MRATITSSGEKCLSCTRKTNNRQGIIFTSGSMKDLSGRKLDFDVLKKQDSHVLLFLEFQDQGRHCFLTKFSWLCFFLAAHVFLAFLALVTELAEVFFAADFLLCFPQPQALFPCLRTIAGASIPKTLSGVITPMQGDISVIIASASGTMHRRTSHVLHE